MSRRQHLSSLKSASPVVLPALLLCDFSDLRSEVRRLEEAGAKALHLDVMDGHFVPNLTYGMPIVEAVRQLTKLPLDVHLMISRPEQFVESFFQAGADIITVHVEAAMDVVQTANTLKRIRELGAGAGLAINPATYLSECNGLWELCDLVLVMSVAAGFGGQKFQDVALEKLKQVRCLVPSATLLEVDGGINTQTIRRCAEAGAELFVAGSAVFRQDSYRLAVEELTRQANIL